LAERSLEERSVGDVAADDLDLSERAALDELALRHPVAHETDHVGAEFEQAPYDPAADQARGPSDQRRAIRPEAGIEVHAHPQTFQGALPVAQRFSSSLRSRMVSMHCQKSPWRKAIS